MFMIPNCMATLQRNYDEATVLSLVQLNGSIDFTKWFQISFQWNSIVVVNIGKIFCGKCSHMLVSTMTEFLAKDNMATWELDNSHSGK